MERVFESLNRDWQRFFIVFIGIINLCFGLVFAEEQKQSFEEKHQDKDLIFLEYGEIPIAYDKEKDKIVEISAYTTTPDGKRHKFTKTNDISPYAPYPIYSNAMVKMVTMPEVNVGSVIEYKVVIESRGSQIKNAFWKELYFTPNVPSKLFRITLILPKKLDIQYKEFNLTYKPKITQNHTTVTYTWEIPDAYDERKAEDYLPPPRVEDLAEGVEFSSIKSWKDISNWYHALVQKNLKITPEIESAAHPHVI